MATALPRMRVDSVRSPARSTGTTPLTTSTESLNFLFLSLLAGLQKLGTVPAIDFAAYQKAIPTRRS